MGIARGIAGKARIVQQLGVTDHLAQALEHTPDAIKYDKFPHVAGWAQGLRVSEILATAGLRLRVSSQLVDATDPFKR